MNAFCSIHSKFLICIFDGIQVLTVSADKSAKVWEISEDGNGKVIKTLASSESGAVEHMLVGCLWQNDHLVTVSLGGRINIFSASDLDKDPISFSGHMKNVNVLTMLKSSQKMILSSSYDGAMIRWIQGVGYSGKLDRKYSAQIKCLAAVKEQIVTSGFDNKVTSFKRMNAKACFYSFSFYMFQNGHSCRLTVSSLVD